MPILMCCSAFFILLFAFVRVGMWAAGEANTIILTYLICSLILARVHTKISEKSPHDGEKTAEENLVPYMNTKLL